MRAKLLAGLRDGSIVPYLGRRLADVRTSPPAPPFPPTATPLIYAMNDGKPMAPKPHVRNSPSGDECRTQAGRTTVQIPHPYLWRNRVDLGAPSMTGWLKGICPQYVIDINPDTQLQDSYADLPHNLIVGIARIGGTAYRYKLYFWDGAAYQATQALNASLPVFKPMGTPRPEPVYIASDADYVDFITELMEASRFHRRSRSSERPVSPPGTCASPRY